MTVPSHSTTTDDRVHTPRLERRYYPYDAVRRAKERIMRPVVRGVPEAFEYEPGRRRRERGAAFTYFLKRVGCLQRGLLPLFASLTYVECTRKEAAVPGGLQRLLHVFVGAIGNAANPLQVAQIRHHCTEQARPSGLCEVCGTYKGLRAPL